MQKKYQKKYRALAYLSLAVLTLLLSGLLSGCKQKTDTPKETFGYINANLIYLSSPRGGRLTRLSIKPGQNIKKGALVFQLKRQQELAAIKEQTANVQQAKATLNDLENNKRRYTKYQIDAAKARVNSVEAALSNARWAYNSKRITAPVSGIIYKTYYQKGEYVPSVRPVVSMWSPKNIKIVFFLSEKNINKVAIGKTVEFHCAQCTINQKATIDFISQHAEFTPEVIFDQQNRQKMIFRVTASINEKVGKQLKLGQPVDIHYE